MSTRRQRPFWLGEGGHLCSSCESTFVLEGGFHCSGCDRPLCGDCAALDAATGEVLCLACRAVEEEVQ